MFTLLNRAKWLLSGNVIFAFSQWLMIILFSHLSDPLQLGYYSYALALTAPIFMLTNLQLRPLLVTDLNTDQQFDFTQYFSLRLFTTSIGITIGILFLINKSYSAGLIILLVILIKASESISDIIYAYYNSLRKIDFITKSLIVKSIFVMVISLLILWMTHNIFYTLIGVLIGYTLTLILIDYQKIKSEVKSKIIFNKKLINLGLMGLPLGISVMLISLQANTPRYFLEYYNSVESVGVFTILYYFIIVGGIIINSICQYISPYLSEFLKEKNVKALKKSILSAGCIALSLGTIGVLGSIPLKNFIMHFFYGQKYLVYSELLPYMMVAGLFSYLTVVTGYVMTSLKMFKIQVPMFGGLVILTIIYSYILIPELGLVGAIYSTIFSAFSQLLISSIFLYRRIQGITL